MEIWLMQQKKCVDWQWQWLYTRPLVVYSNYHRLKNCIAPACSRGGRRWRRADGDAVSTLAYFWSPLGERISKQAAVPVQAMSKEQVAGDGFSQI